MPGAKVADLFAARLLAHGRFGGRQQYRALSIANSTVATAAAADRRNLQALTWAATDADTARQLAILPTYRSRSHCAESLQETIKDKEDGKEPTHTKAPPVWSDRLTAPCRDPFPPFRYQNQHRLHTSDGPTARHSPVATMSNANVGNIYQQIINEVIEASRVDFEEGGVEESVLDDLRKVCFFCVF